MELKQVIAMRIKELRTINNMVQKDIAKALNTTQASIGRYEQGIISPTNEQLLWYADHFKVSLDWIYGRTDVRKGGFIHKPIKEMMSKDLKELLGEELEPGQDIYKLIKKNVEEMVNEMNKKQKK